MSAILTENFRLLNTKNFLNYVNNNFNTQVGSGSSISNIYLFVSRIKEWDNSQNPPNPINNYRYYSDISDQIISLKKLTPTNFIPVVKNNTWSSGIVYSMYRPDYTAGNTEGVGTGNTRYPRKTTSNGQLDIFLNPNFYVINSNYQVYKCLNNGQSPNNPNGAPSTVQPSGNSTSPIRTSDGYTWKYLYSIPPQYIINFVTDDYIPVPLENTTFSPESAVKNSSVDGAVESAIIISSGNGYTNGSYTLPVNGDYSVNGGSQSTISIIVNGSQIESATVVNRGSKYTFGTIDLSPLGPGTGGNIEIVVSPKYGHGYSPFDELGAYRVMVSSRISYAEFPQDISYRQIGLLSNPFNFGTTSISTGNILNGTKSVTFSSVSGNFIPGEKISQSKGTGITAYGVAVSWSSNSNTLKYYQDQYDGVGTGNSLIPISGNNSIVGLQSNATGTGSSNYLNESIQKNTGKILYLDNREVVNRSSNQTEDIKIVVEF